MPLTAREMIRLLEKNGFEVTSQNGSHVKLINRETKKQTIVPVHSGSLKRGLEKAILRQAGLEVSENDK